MDLKHVEVFAFAGGALFWMEGSVVAWRDLHFLSVHVFSEHMQRTIINACAPEQASFILSTERFFADSEHTLCRQVRI